MVEIKLHWRIKKTKKGDKEYLLDYISVPGSIAGFLLDKEPFLDPQKMIIFFRPKQNDTHYITGGNIVIKLHWRIKKTKKGDKEYPVCYISVPRRSAIFLLDKEPFLDPQKMIIFFRPKQNDTQIQPQSQ